MFAITFIYGSITSAVNEVPLEKYKYIFALLTFFFNFVNNEKSSNNNTAHTTPKCPFTQIIEDIFKMKNKTVAGNLENKDKTKLFLNSIADVTTDDKYSNKTMQDALVDSIIASINRIKNNITNQTNDDERKLNEAIILNVPKHLEKSDRRNDDIKISGIKSGIEEKNDAKLNPDKDAKIKLNKLGTSTTKRPTFVEILTIEPNNTKVNVTTSHNILEVLKHLMPMFNSTLTKELHNITIIERNHNKNRSISATKNISTIVVTYCDKENLTKANVTFENAETDIVVPKNASGDNDYLDSDEAYDYEDFRPEVNLTNNEKKDILEAVEYGMQKMHELYAVMEPKLYSMGLWLDDKNPARYVAAFNAPSEDAAKYYRYGYASLQAAAKLKQLTSGDGLESRTEEQFPAASALRQSPLLQHCPLRGAPKCPPASKRYRTHDGTCNNVNRPRWGSTMTPVQRFLPPSYADGIQSPRRSVFGSALPSAREISSMVHEDQHVETPGITHLLMQWGQFLDHDVTSSSQSRGFNGSVPRCCKDGGRDFVPKEFLHPECLPIAVPPSDPFYGPKGVRCLDFVRSSPAPRDDCALGWREQMNQVSAYIDGSPLYASSARQSDKLRLFRNGMLQYGRVQNRRPLLPPDRDELCRGGAVSSDCFKSGDARVNEHPGLVAAHIVWLRQHNRMAQELAHLNPHWSDEKVYQETRKIVGAMIQHISYREFLPIVLGQEVMRLFDLEPRKKGYYTGYSPKINPSPASSFGSAAFRFGHSLVQPSMIRFDRFHRPMKNNVSLHAELTNPSNIWSMGAVDRLLLGMVNQPIQKRDEFITEELTNHLFQTPSFDFGMDLAAINIQRGRDHGIAPYTAWREPCGLSAITEFEDLFRVMSARAVRKMQNLYRNVDDIDLFTGGMSERPVVGGLVGPTFACIIAQQFSNLRKGDRFWYENGGFESSLTPAQLQQIRRISFAQILCRTLDTIDSIQPFVFLSADNTDNDRISCLNGLLNNFDLSPWTDVNSSNDISKSDETSTERPKVTKTTTTKKPSTKKPQKIPLANKVGQKKPLVNTTQGLNVTKPKLTHRRNKTDSIDDNVNTTTTDNDAATETTVQKIDDKLDFKNKSRRYEDVDSRRNYKKPTKQYGNDYDDDEEVHSVQSVVINNLQHKRPYNRPVIAVTENINKYTYLINYVPRPTQSWRQTTRRSHDRDVVKVTYQTYDDTYRRPNKPYYYNRQEDRNDNSNYRQGDRNDNSDNRQDDQKDNSNYSQDDRNDNSNYRQDDRNDNSNNRQDDRNYNSNNKQDDRNNNYNHRQIDRNDDNNHRQDDRNDKNNKRQGDRNDKNNNRQDEKNDNNNHRQDDRNDKNNNRQGDRNDKDNNRQDERNDNNNHRQDDRNDKNNNRQGDRNDKNNNRQDERNDKNQYRQNRPDLEDYVNFSSARSNNKVMTTTKSEETIDKIDVTDNIKPTTENIYKLVTFGYVGTYKGDAPNNKKTEIDLSDKAIKRDVISKDFSTYEDGRLDKDEKANSMKLSTFFHYETATKPYSNFRPTRRYDDDQIPEHTKTNSKYYFIRNVLRKYPDDNSTITDKTEDKTKDKDILAENYNSPGHPVPVMIEQRSSANKLAMLEEVEAKSANPDPEKLKLKLSKPSSSAKTPSVAFQVIPSENNPSQWAIYEEKDLPEGLPHRMPPIKTDPHALKEIPRPFNFGNLRRRPPGRGRQ